MERREHWQQVYAAKSPTEVSWYERHLADSLRLVERLAQRDARIIDIGGGASTLVDDLLERGYRHLTVLDISERALERARARLGPFAAQVQWLAADVTNAALEDAAFDLWHDRAVFHFLTDAADRRAYVRRLRRGLVHGGHVIMATFALTGPSMCSGLPVVRYDASTLAAELGTDFERTDAFEVTHTTPTGKEQRFQFCVFEKRV